MLARLCLMRGPCSKGHSVEASKFCVVRRCGSRILYFLQRSRQHSSARLVPSQQVSEWQNSGETLRRGAGVDSKYYFVIKNPLVYLSYKAHVMVVLHMFLSTVSCDALTAGAALMQSRLYASHASRLHAVHSISRSRLLSLELWIMTST